MLAGDKSGWAVCTPPPRGACWHSSAWARKLHPLNINIDNTNNGNNPNPDNTYWHDLTDQLCRVRTLRRGLPASTKTWIDAAQDRVLWKQIVYQRF